MCEKYGSDDKTRFLVLYFDAQMNIHEISIRIDRSVRTLEAWVRRVKKGEEIRMRTKRKQHKKQRKPKTKLFKCSKKILK